MAPGGDLTMFPNSDEGYFPLKEIEWAILFVCLIIILTAAIFFVGRMIQNKRNRKTLSQNSESVNTKLHYTKEILNAISEEFGKYDTIERALLFGSRARGDNTERSDYDVAVFGDVIGADKVRLRAWAEDELLTLHKIDLIFVSDISDAAFLASIEKEGICFYDKVRK